MMITLLHKTKIYMHTGQRNPLHSPEDEQYDRLVTQLFSGKLIQDQNKFSFSCFIFS